MDLLKITNLLKQAGSETIIQNMSLTLNKREIIGIKCNQTASETLFNILEGRMLSSGGTIEGEYIDSVISLRISDGLYDKLKVKDYFKFFRSVAGTDVNISELINNFFLIDVMNTPIKKLTIAQAKRIALARTYLSKPRLILFEEPFSGLDNESIKYLMDCFTYVRSKNTAVIVTSTHLEDIAILGGSLYILDAHGFRKIDSTEENPAEEKPNLDQRQEEETIENNALKPINISKISCKVEGKIILFNPDEIDYIESVDSICKRKSNNFQEV